LKLQGGNGMNDNRVEEFMKKHPPWFIFDFHPVRSAKKISEEEKKIEKEMNEVMEKETEANSKKE
jgi:hypothetical protein